MELLGQTSDWEQTYLGATDLDTEGTWTWIKSGGSTFWEGGDPTAGGAVVSGMFANFFDGEPNDGGAGQDCLIIGVIFFFSHGSTYSPRKATGNGATSCAQRRVSSCARRRPQKEEHPSLQRQPLSVPPLVRFPPSSPLCSSTFLHCHPFRSLSSLSSLVRFLSSTTTFFPSVFLHL